MGNHGRKRRPAWTADQDRQPRRREALRCCVIERRRRCLHRPADFGFWFICTAELAKRAAQRRTVVLDRYARQILQTIERDGFYVRVPAGKEFYLYLTQTLDRADAKIGGTAISPAEVEAHADQVSRSSALARRGGIRRNQHPALDLTNQ